MSLRRSAQANLADWHAVLSSPELPEVNGMAAANGKIVFLVHGVVISLAKLNVLVLANHALQSTDLVLELSDSSVPCIDYVLLLDDIRAHQLEQDVINNS